MDSSKPVLVNLFGGPGAGKTTTALGLTYELKMMGFKAEYVHELAKDFAFLEDLSYFENQLSVTRKQAYLLNTRLVQNLDFVITDAPLAVGLVYGEMYGTIFNDEAEILGLARKHPNQINIIKTRPKSVSFEQHGRYQTEQEANKVQAMIMELLVNKHKFFMHGACENINREGISFLAQRIVQMAGKQ